MVERWEDPTRVCVARKIFTVSGSRASCSKSNTYYGEMGLLEDVLVLIKCNFV